MNADLGPIGRPGAFKPLLAIGRLLWPEGDEIFFLPDVSERGDPPPFLFFRIGNIGKFDAFNYPIFSLEDGMSSSHEKFPDRKADFSKAGEEGGKAIENATDAAASLLSSAKASAGDFAGNAAETFKSAVEEQKTAGAGAIGDVARAAKGAADNFQDRAPELANAVRTVAGRVEGISNDIRDRSVNELMATVTEFAGQKPMAFFGCGILAGLVISRLLSSSNR